ncbi:hypothetical protein ACFX2H_015843 [Malus domestica]
MMDKSWASFNLFTEDYRTGLAKFISNSLEVASHEGNIKCPCAKCLNRFWLSNKEVEAHLIVEGMDRSYLQGSVMGGMPINNHSEQEASIPAYARKFEAMVQDANTELYPGCASQTYTPKWSFFTEEVV